MIALQNLDFWGMVPQKDCDILERVSSYTWAEHTYFLWNIGQEERTKGSLSF